jgi:hypothetical protein
MRVLRGKLKVATFEDPRRERRRIRARGGGGVLRPTLTNHVTDAAKELGPQTRGGQVLSGDSPITKVIERVELLKDRELSLRSSRAG